MNVGDIVKITFSIDAEIDRFIGEEVKIENIDVVHTGATWQVQYSMPAMITIYEVTLSNGTRVWLNEMEIEQVA